MSREALNTPLMSAAAADPFYVFRDALQTQVDKVKLQYDQWKDALDNTNTHKNAEFPKLHRGLKSALKSLDGDLNQLEGTVVMVEKDRAKFSHISEPELASRRAFVDDTRRRIKEMRAEHGSRRTLGKIDKDKKDSLMTRSDGAPGGTGAGGGGAFEAAHGEFIGDQKQRQAQMRREQDDHLDALGDSVERLGAMASTINVELAEQERMIDDLDKDVDEAQGNMDQALKQIQKILKTKDKCQLWTIFGLVVIFMILCVLVFM